MNTTKARRRGLGRKENRTFGEGFMPDKFQPVAKAEMMIRKPVAEVFEAFVNPAITSKFWFTKGSARLEAGQQVTWEWEMYHLSSPVNVKAVEENTRILVEWGCSRHPTTVEWLFQ